MSNYATLKAAIQSAVYTNNNNEITGAGLQGVLLQIVNAVGDGYLFKGVATAGTSPGTPDENVFYIAGEGVYTNFGGRNIVNPTEIGVLTYNGSWSFSKINVGQYAQYTDNNDANMLLSAVLVDSSVAKIRFTIGTTNNVNILFYDGSDTQVGGAYFANVDTMPDVVRFSAGTTQNIVIFNIGALRQVVNANVGGVNYYISGTFTAMAHDTYVFYLDKRMSAKMMGGGGLAWCDDDIINALFPNVVLTEDVKKIHVTLAENAINVLLKDAGGNTLTGRYISDIDAFEGSVFEITANSSTSLTDGLMLIDKRFVKNFYDLNSPYPSVGYLEFDGDVIGNGAYAFVGKSEVFGQSMSKDYGTGGISIDSGTAVGINVYNTVDAFRFPCVIDTLTIPAVKDGIVEVYRTRMNDTQDVSQTDLLCTLHVKEGTHTYNVSIPMSAGEGIGFSAPSVMKYFITANWRLASYSVETLLRQTSVTGFTNGTMMFGMTYRYFAVADAKPLQGSRISILGDSIDTFGSGYSYSDPYYPSSDIYNYMQTWWGRLHEDGAEIMSNMSVSRTTVQDPNDESIAYRWLGYGARISGLGTDGNAPDIIIVRAGINDMFSTAVLGDFDFTKQLDDYTQLDALVFSTAYQRVVMNLIDTYPTSKIFICTPFKAGNSAWGFPERNGSRFMLDMNKKIKELANALGVGCIDFYSEVGISWQQMNTGVYGDVIHPNKEGHYKYYEIARRHLIDYVQSKIKE